MSTPPPSRPLVCAVAFALLSMVLVGIGSTPASADDSVGHLPTPEDFVTQQYEDFLGRAPDAEGLGYWAGLLRDGSEPSDLVEAMATSAEFEGVVAPLVRLYFAFFNRAPDYDGLIYWTDQIRAGASLQQVAQQFVLSAEFQATYGSVDDRGYVELVYGNVLDRGADADGLGYWTGRLAAGVERGELMAAFADSAEYRRAIGPKVQATMLYVGMLRRAPDPAGLDYWAEVIAGQTPYGNVIAGFLGAAEYGERITAIYDEVQPLTGVATRAAANRPALAVKIDNVDAARPQHAIERADLVYEEKVEGNLTRLIAVFHSDLPETIGPVRSVRTTDIDVLDQLNTPLLAASGANPGVLAVVAGADLVNVNAIEAGAAYFRQSGRRAPHNLFARTSSLYEAADGQGGLPPQLFSYRSRGQDPNHAAGTGGVEIDFGSTTVGFGWSTSAKGWLRTQNGSAHTSTGGRLAPENVVVLEVPYGTSSIDAESPEANTVGSGRAWVFTAGQVVTGTWARSASEDPIAVLDPDGQPIGLTPGQTFIELAPPGSVTLR